MARYSENKGEYFAWWIEDRKYILSIMYRNMACDLSYGYDPMGKAIMQYKHDIAEFEKYINDSLEMFKSMDENAIDRWCFYDMIKHGVID